MLYLYMFYRQLISVTYMWHESLLYDGYDDDDDDYHSDDKGVCVTHRGTYILSV